MELENDAAYYRRRETTARELSEKSQDVSIQRIHRDMAERYRTLAEKADKGSTTVGVQGI